MSEEWKNWVAPVGPATYCFQPIKYCIVFQNPDNHDDKIEFESIEALNAHLFSIRAENQELKERLSRHEPQHTLEPPQDKAAG